MRLSRLLGVLIVVPAMVVASAMTGLGNARQPTPVKTNATSFNDASVPGADPHVLRDPESGYYYAYSTEGADEGYQFAIYRSVDLASWKRLPGGALSMADAQWGKDWFWAPEVYHNAETGLYYLFYSARMREGVGQHFRYPDFEEPSKIGVAVARAPQGPFHNIVDHPIDYYPYDPDYHDVNLIMDETQKKPPETLEEGQTAPLGTYVPYIDPNVFFDDGRIYLYYSRNAYRNWVWDHDLGKYIEEANIYAVELTADWWHDPTGSTMPSIHPRYVNANRDEQDPTDVRKDGFTPILDYGSDPQQWENAHVHDYENSGGKFKNRRWEEGSTTIKTRTAQGRPLYFLLYSANNFANAHYGVGYAVADNPLGPWKKSPRNPILRQDEQMGMFSTGHGSPIAAPDGEQLYYVHHGRPNTGTNRRLYTAPMEIDPDAASVRIKGTTRDQPIPGGIAPFTLNSDPLLIDLSSGSESLKWTVQSASGAAMNLEHALNRVSLSVRPDNAVRVDKRPDHAVVSGDPVGVAALSLRYQRKPATGAYFGVDNITGAGTPDEQHRPVAATLPVTRCDSLITGAHAGDVVVDSGVTCLRDATVTGAVRVGANASVVLVNSEVRGSVRANGASSVWMLGGWVKGVDVRSASGIVRIDDVHVGGSAVLHGNSAPVISGSTVDRKLSCQDNDPAPRNERKPNTVHGAKLGQCARL